MENSISKSTNTATNRNNEHLSFHNSTFDDLFRSFFRTSSMARPEYQDYRMVEHDDSYELMFDIPGADKENVAVDVTKNNVLQIRVSNETSQDEDSVKSYSVTEKSWNLSLGRDVDTENITGSLERGVLTMTIPKWDQGQDGTKRIEIT